MINKKFYITTAIDYVNARPHIGHAFEKILADALARWHKLKGEEVWFLTGTDENAQKNARVAKEEGIDVQKFVDRNSKWFIELCEKLNVDYDRFIRTTEEEHKKKAQEIFKKVYDKGEIYKGKYEGLYCIGCEEYKTERDLVDGKCPEHNKAPESISEDAYFFKLSKYEKKLIKFVKNYIVPDGKKKEILSRLESEGLRDLCVSRTNLDWGIDSPIDDKFKIWVWFDALINYVSGASGNWPADVHIVGKGINWFHSVIWPAMLMSAGIELPKKLLVHGYVNLKGKKIGKSLGNVINPIELAEKYGVDSVRYSLLKGSVFEDFDYSEEVLIERNNSELLNKLGNLVSRVGSLAENAQKSKISDATKSIKDFDGYGIEKCENKLLKKLKLKEIEKSFEGYELDKALNEIFAFIDVCNEYVQKKKPWETKVQENSGEFSVSPKSIDNKILENKKVLYELVDSIKAIGILLWPFVPGTSEKIASQFGFKIKFDEIEKGIKVSKIKKGEHLFSKIELKD